MPENSSFQHMYPPDADPRSGELDGAVHYPLVIGGLATHEAVATAPLDLGPTNQQLRLAAADPQLMDHQAIARFIVENPVFGGYCKKLIHHYGIYSYDADDIHQAVALRLEESRPDIRQHGSLLHPRQLVVIARNIAIDMARRRIPYPNSLIDELRLTATNAQQETIEATEKRILLSTLLGWLSSAHRAVIDLQLQGYANGEIAQKLGIPEGTVKSRRHTALMTLRAALNNTHPYDNSLPQDTEQA